MRTENSDSERGGSQGHVTERVRAVRVGTNVFARPPGTARKKNKISTLPNL